MIEIAKHIQALSQRHVTHSAYIDEEHYLMFQVVNLGLFQLGCSERAMTLEKVEPVYEPGFTGEKYRVFAHTADDCHVETLISLTVADIADLMKPYLESKHNAEVTP